MDRFASSPRVLMFDEKDDDESIFSPSIESETETAGSSNADSDATNPTAPTSEVEGPRMLKYADNTFILPPSFNSDTESEASFPKDSKAISVAFQATKYFGKSSEASGSDDDLKSAEDTDGLDISDDVMSPLELMYQGFHSKAWKIWYQ